MATLDVLTLGEAKAALNLAGTGQYDAELPAWITATSLTLDAKVGPVVKRTITDEVHNGGCGHVFTKIYPVAEWTTVTEYVNTTGTVLTIETNASKPAAGFYAEPYDPDPSLFSGFLYRSATGARTGFAAGVGNVVLTYKAGRFEDTGSVDERFKTGARLILQNLWNSQRPNLANVDEFEVPQSNWPRFAVPNAVRQMLANEWQDRPGAG